MVELADARAATRRRVWASGDAGPFFRTNGFAGKIGIHKFFKQPSTPSLRCARSIICGGLDAVRGAGQATAWAPSKNGGL
jgi:hypothetical protein